MIQKRLLGCPGREGVVPLDLPIALNLAKACSLRSARSSASSRSTWALRNLAKFKAAISSASSICLLKHRTYKRKKAFKLFILDVHCIDHSVPKAHFWSKIKLSKTLEK